MTLNQLELQQSAKIAELPQLQPLRLRLMTMGLLPGTLIKVIGCAPLGDPLEIELRNYRLSLRLSEAKQLTVTPLEGEK